MYSLITSALFALTLASPAPSNKAGDFVCIDTTKFMQFTSDTAFVVNSCPAGFCFTRTPPLKNPCIGKARALQIDVAAAAVAPTVATGATPAVATVASPAVATDAPPVVATVAPPVVATVASPVVATVASPVVTTVAAAALGAATTAATIVPVSAAAATSLVPASNTSTASVGPASSTSQVSDAQRLSFLLANAANLNDATLVPLTQPEMIPVNRVKTAAEGCLAAQNAFICVDLARNVRCVNGVVSKNFVKPFSANDLIKSCVGGFCGGTASTGVQSGNKCVLTAQQAVDGNKNGNEFFLPPP